MLLSENMHSLTKEWALKRIDRTPMPYNLFVALKLYRVERVVAKYKALIGIIFLLIMQFAAYDFDMSEYTTSNSHGASVQVKAIKMPAYEYS
jgi:hypothetical protein